MRNIILMNFLWCFDWIFNIQFRKIVDDFSLKFSDWRGAKVCKSCRSRKMLQNDYLVAKIGVHIDENEPSQLTNSSEARARLYLLLCRQAQSSRTRPILVQVACGYELEREERYLDWCRTGANLLRLSSNSRCLGNSISNFPCWNLEIWELRETPYM